jgi:hypothetical protein
MKSMYRSLTRTHLRVSPYLELGASPQCSSAVNRTWSKNVRHSNAAYRHWKAFHLTSVQILPRNYSELESVQISCPLQRWTNAQVYNSWKQFCPIEWVRWETIPLGDAFNSLFLVKCLPNIPDFRSYAVLLNSETHDVGALQRNRHFWT